MTKAKKIEINLLNPLLLEDRIKSEDVRKN
jgi:hypothetical protein